MSWMSEPEAWIAFATLLGLEIVLGVDNIIFIGILAGKLPKDQQAKARYLGLSLALVMRIILLFSITWVVGLTATLFSVFGMEVSGRDLILFFGGLFLIGLCLVAEGWGHHIPKGYVYFAMGFSIMVEAVNIRIRSVQAPVKLHEAYAVQPGTEAAGKAGKHG